MEIVKVKDYDNEGGALPKDALKMLAAKNLRPFTKEEWQSKEAISDAEMKELYLYTPVLLQEPNGLLSRNYGWWGGDYRRYVFAYFWFEIRFGVVGTPIGAKGKKHKHVWECECGKKRR
jgi:hypothetical protein